MSTFHEIFLGLWFGGALQFIVGAVAQVVSDLLTGYRGPRSTDHLLLIPAMLLFSALGVAMAMSARWMDRNSKAALIDFLRRTLEARLDDADGQSRTNRQGRLLGRPSRRQRHRHLGCNLAFVAQHG